VQQTFNFPAPIRAIETTDTRMVVGTESCEIFQVSNFTSKVEPQRLVYGHNDGELWGLDVHPRDTGQCVTAGEDNQIIIWDLKTHQVKTVGTINSAPAQRRRKRERAATSSAQPAQCCARAVSYSPNGQHVALGTNEGEVAIYETGQLSRLFCHNLNEFAKQQVAKRWGNWIQALRYSPNGSVLAAGTHGGVVVLMDCKSSYNRDGVLNKMTSAVTHLDWDDSSKVLQTNDMSYELLYHTVGFNDKSGEYELKTAKQNTRGASQYRDLHWKTQSCRLGWPVQGVYDPTQDGSDVGSVDRSPDEKLLATGDNYGKVNLFRFPIPYEHATANVYPGHSSHVMCVRWTPDQQYLLSVGGNDKALIQWRLV